MTQLILASSSPRRRELLTSAGYEFTIVPPRPEAEDQAPRLEDPGELVVDLARRKGADVVGQLLDQGLTDAWVLSADTVAECQGEVLGKPTGQSDARRILLALSGQLHKVLSGVTLWRLATPDQPVQTCLAVTTLQMDTLSEEWLAGYLSSGAWQGKAGAFGYQDGLGFVRIVEGSESNVVGLPMAETREMLARHAALKPAAG